MTGTPISPGNAWATPVEDVLARYLIALADGHEHREQGDRDAIEAHLRSALRAESIARGCPSLAMLTPLDLLGVRAHLEAQGVEAGPALSALERFLSWGRQIGAHSLSAAAVTRALRVPEA